jgi:hypothetical protein
MREYFKGEITLQLFNLRNIYRVLVEKNVHKDYYGKSSVGKKSLVVGLKGPDAKTK